MKPTRQAAHRPLLVPNSDGGQNYSDMIRLFLLFRKILARAPALYFVINALCWFSLGIYFKGISTGLSGMILANIIILALLVIYTSIFNRAKPLELLDRSSVFLNNDKSFFTKVFVMGAPLFGLLSVYAYLIALLVAVIPYTWDYLSFALRFIKRGDRNEASLEAITEYKPTVCAYVSGAPESAYQINMWLEVLEKLPHKTIILITDRKIYLNMRETVLPVVFASSIDDVFNVFQTGIQCVLYPANGQKNAPAFRYSQATHCFINHGESDKGVNASKFLMAYDKLFLAGQTSLDRMLAAGLPVRDEQIKFVGRPQLEQSLEKRSGTGVKKILYAPTWEGFVESEDYTSIDTVGLEVIKNLHKTGKYEIVFRPHPFTGRRRKDALNAQRLIADFCKLNNIRISMNGDENIYQAMNDCDLMLSDVSSTLVDFLFTEKPMVLCMGRQPDEARLQEMASLKAAYKLKDSADVAELIEAIAREDDLSAVRQATTEDYIANSGIGSFDLFAEAVRECVIMPPNSEQFPTTKSQRAVLDED